MADQHISRPKTRAQLIPLQANDQAGTQRMMDQLTDQVNRLTRPSRSVVVVDLVVGDNVVTHLLGRVPSGCIVCPTVADASFAWALSDKNERQATITVIGVDQPASPIEFW